MNKTLVVVTGLLVACIVLLTVVTQLEASDKQDIYSRYNTYQMFEDGSYKAELLTGEKITGCIKNALCNKE